MRLIHTADLHLDSKLNANLDSEKAKKRRAEIVNTFSRLVSYAVSSRVDAILISGDLFDTSHVLKSTSDLVYGEIERHPEITFFYLKGNHDKNDFLTRFGEIPENLKLFSDRWTTYYLSDRVTVSGLELNPENTLKAAPSLSLQLNRVNLVMLHGQEAKSVKKGAELIDLKAFQNKGIDYLALGHIHFRKKEKLDSRGIYVYPGILDGRGFDETGTHGFSLLDIDEERGRIEETFVPFASRTLYEITVDVTGDQTAVEMIARVSDEINRRYIASDSLVKIVLTGGVAIDTDINTDLITEAFLDKFFFVKTENQTHVQVNFEDFKNDISLKGEFVRQVAAEESYSEEEKKRILKIGFEALNMEV